MAGFDTTSVTLHLWKTFVQEFNTDVVKVYISKIGKAGAENKVWKLGKFS